MSRSVHPPIDPEVLAAEALADPPGIPSLLMAEIPARRAGNVYDPEELRRGGAIQVQERRAPGPTGDPDVDVVVLRPAAGPQGPGIVYIHGGGMVMGTHLAVESTMLDAVEDFGAVVVSVGYRLAPEHPYPAGLEDCYAGLAWTADHAAELGIDPNRLLVAGSSAGGGLAAGIALLARDRGGPVLTHQVLYCPMLDDREITASSQELDGEARWDRTANRTGWTALLGTKRGGPDVPHYAAPARATDLAGLPSTFVDVGAVDTFRDEDIDYAVRLARAGVQVELHVWPGGTHGFYIIAPNAALSKAALNARRDYLARILSPTGGVGPTALPNPVDLHPEW